MARREDRSRRAARPPGGWLSSIWRITRARSCASSSSSSREQDLRGLGRGQARRPARAPAAARCLPSLSSRWLAVEVALAVVERLLPAREVRRAGPRATAPCRAGAPRCGRSRRGARAARARARRASVASRAVGPRESPSRRAPARAACSAVPVLARRAPVRAPPPWGGTSGRAGVARPSASGRIRRVSTLTATAAAPDATSAATTAATTISMSGVSQPPRSAGSALRNSSGGATRHHETPDVRWGVLPLVERARGLLWTRRRSPLLSVHSVRSTHFAWFPGRRLDGGARTLIVPGIRLAATETAASRDVVPRVRRRNRRKASAMSPPRPRGRRSGRSARPRARGPAPRSGRPRSRRRRSSSPAAWSPTAWSPSGWSPATAWSPSSE